ncbi:hypothetical protein FA95DRAFT_1562746 [Auriscalpium vulgare]|uniref:Uncharacterized protein n=1 Tax=Auriscalpium vulgare TaxID=40419 RepID=A0ACB8RIB4_9AGAM|nr:hypothetical protein FA95DRAFT_1562746 [Auriscalpium vulgare]
MVSEFVHVVSPAGTAYAWADARSDSRNILRLMNTGYGDVLHTALLGLITLAGRQAVRDYVWFEKAAFSFAVLLPHCGTTTPLLHTSTAEYVLSHLFKQVPQISAYNHGSPHREPAPWIGLHLLVGALIHVHLHEVDRQDPNHLVIPLPRGPRFVAELEYYDWPLTVPGDAPRPRKWLADDARRTPLGRLPRARPGSPWVGYYLFANGAGLQRDPPMRLNLYSGEKRSHFFQLNGTGTDGAGSFILDGHFSVVDGYLIAKKVYGPGEGWLWEWKGTLTPWGALGRWGNTNYGGWWMIWPKEESDSEPVAN